MGCEKSFVFMWSVDSGIHKTIVFRTAINAVVTTTRHYSLPTIRNASDIDKVITFVQCLL